jgi:hypothetical protein
MIHLYVQRWHYHAKMFYFEHFYFLPWAYSSLVYTILKKLAILVSQTMAGSGIMMLMARVVVSCLRDE